MFAKKIVVAYNDTDLSNDLLNYVHQILILDPKMKLDIIYSFVEPPTNQSPFQRNPDVIDTEMVHFAESVIIKGKEKFKDLPNEVEGFIYNNSPATAILDHANDFEADLIVIGNRGFSGLREFVSSVSRTVQSKSKIPVLTFPKFAQEILDEQEQQ